MVAFFLPQRDGRSVVISQPHYYRGPWSQEKRRVSGTRLRSGLNPRSSPGDYFAASAPITVDRPPPAVGLRHGTQSKEVAGLHCTAHAPGSTHTTSSSSSDCNCAFHVLLYYSVLVALLPPPFHNKLSTHLFVMTTLSVFCHSGDQWNVQP
ncbi:uncharacterized protein BDW43DRAFT_212876 [Aspergillus alliaceus]|uniref:uncharacterized protein n=1 Tax=Petromyces alliaceus TaxID=209559 RepID=UPI0012A6FF4A|nr:uncharacterized protein BDW43DRAFT_212876 [Aspergillus alliaceus]KAB8228683.1 hypothetical protein BDW43DRAFT_212876 [Aspergillus alliaceus]